MKSSLVRLNKKVEGEEETVSELEDKAIETS